MKILISIDDTDDIDSRGTGDVAELMARGLADSGLAECGRVTRHQLLIHPDIAYTSHNSAMCFPAETDVDSLDAVTAWCQATLAAESVAAADPGLCIAAVETLAEPDALDGLRAGRQGARLQQGRGVPDRRGPARAPLGAWRDAASA